MASKILGVAELSKQLQDLGDPKATKSVLVGSARSAMARVLKQARATVPVGKKAHRTYKGRLVAPGFLKRNLKVVAFVARDGSVVALMGPKKEAYYGTQFVELGTARVAARPWLVPAFEQSQFAVIKDLTAGMRKRIERIAKRRAAGGG